MRVHDSHSLQKMHPDDLPAEDRDTGRDVVRLAAEASVAAERLLRDATSTVNRTEEVFCELKKVLHDSLELLNTAGAAHLKSAQLAIAYTRAAAKCAKYAAVQAAHEAGTWTGVVEPGAVESVEAAEKESRVAASWARTATQHASLVRVACEQVMRAVPAKAVWQLATKRATPPGGR